MYDRFTGSPLFAGRKLNGHKHSKEILNVFCISYVTMYLRMDQVRFRPYHFNFLKVVFQKFHLVHSWILCPLCTLNLRPISGFPISILEVGAPGVGKERGQPATSRGSSLYLLMSYTRIYNSHAHSYAPIPNHDWGKGGYPQLNPNKTMY